MVAPHDPKVRSDLRRQAFLPFCLLASLLIVFARLAYLQVWSPATKIRTESTGHRSRQADGWSRATDRLRREVRRVGKGTALLAGAALIGTVGLGLSAALGRRRRSQCR